MKRWLIRICGTLSLLLLAGTVWMWVRSYWFDDQLQRKWVGTATTTTFYERKSNLDQLLWIGSSRGRVAVMTVDKISEFPRRDDRPVIQWWWSEDATDFKTIEQSFPNWKRLLGVGFGSFRILVAGGVSNGIGSTSRCVIVPWAYVAFIFIVAPLWWARLAIKDKRKVERAIRGLCVHCGYDLRGAGGICPECGKGKARETTPTSKPI